MKDHLRSFRAVRDAEDVARGTMRSVPATTTTIATPATAAADQSCPRSAPCARRGERRDRLDAESREHRDREAHARDEHARPGQRQEHGAPGRRAASSTTDAPSVRASRLSWSRAIPCAVGARGRPRSLPVRAGSCRTAPATSRCTNRPRAPTATCGGRPDSRRAGTRSHGETTGIHCTADAASAISIAMTHATTAATSVRDRSRTRG